MKTLDQIAVEKSCNRSSAGAHDYFVTYDEVFGHLREEPVNLIELGVLGGAGLQVWAKGFSHPATRIVGADVNLEHYKPIDDKRVTVVKASQDEPSLATRFPNRFWDIVIDDASHFADQQKRTFRNFWHLVRSGGFYCIEDIHFHRSPRHAPRGNIVKWVTRRIRDMQRWDTLEAKRTAGDTIDWVLVRKGLAIFKKL